MKNKFVFLAFKWKTNEKTNANMHEVTSDILPNERSIDKICKIDLFIEKSMSTLLSISLPSSDYLSSIPRWTVDFAQVFIEFSCWCFHAVGTENDKHSFPSLSFISYCVKASSIAAIWRDFLSVMWLAFLSEIDRWSGEIHDKVTDHHDEFQHKSSVTTKSEPMRNK